ncbi:hypothetical protein LOD99_10516 [Oopsacas minuta]|uniref:Uncharacterized protein n=1 Tax=Oopsacas minuta TaxID=111878 RepID=A0AAV7KHK3_9METZ|nr:hypothetical protein LOD99_10516 [Oopsacas minuta]
MTYMFTYLLLYCIPQSELISGILTLSINLATMATAITIETERVETGNDYTSKMKPLVCATKRGKGNDKLYCPLGVTVDKMTGDIYIVDSLNNISFSSFRMCNFHFDFIS